MSNVKTMATVIERPGEAAFREVTLTPKMKRPSGVSIIADTINGLFGTSSYRQGTWFFDPTALFNNAYGFMA